MIVMWLVALLIARSVRVTIRATAETMRDGRAAFEVSSVAYLLRHVLGPDPIGT
jgi:hypothetical protein